MRFTKWVINRGIPFKALTFSLMSILLVTLGIVILALPHAAPSGERVMLEGAACLLVITLVITAAVHRVLVSPVEKVICTVTSLTQGTGHMPGSPAAGAGGDIGRLAESIDRFVGDLQGTINSVAATIDGLSGLSASVRNTVLAAEGSVHAQCGSVGGIAVAVGELDDSIKAIADDADELLLSAEATSSSTTGISASIREVAQTTDTLDAAADTIHSAVNQISNSLKQVTANLVLLAELTSSASSSAAKISDAIKDVTAHAQDQAGIASDVKEAAATAGLEAVNSTRYGMEKIRQEVSTTNDAIESLSSKSDQIGKIVEVIGNVAEETNLLALNAAILAAQSGENGKAFAVIAEKIRWLAKRSAESTKDIGEIINHVQRDIALAGKAAKRSIAEVDSGVLLSSAAEKALNEIVAKAETSLDMALKVESSVAEQSKSVELNASAIQNFKKMSADIKKAVAKQSQSAEDILRGVKELRDCTGTVKISLAEQSAESENIAAVVQGVFSRAQVIARGAKEQRRMAEGVVSSVDTAKVQVEENLALCHELKSAADGLSDRAAILFEKTRSCETAQFPPLTGSQDTTCGNDLAG